MSNPKQGPSRHRSRRGTGQAMVEFALVVPVFLLVLSGILDFGFMLFTRMSVINAAREGARYGAMYADPTNLATVVKNRVSSAASSGGIFVDPNDSNAVTVVCLQTTSSSYSATTQTPKCSLSALYNKNTNPSGAQPGDSVSVTVNYSYKSFFPLLFGTSFNLSSTVQMVLDNVTTG